MKYENIIILIRLIYSAILCVLYTINARNFNSAMIGLLFGYFILLHLLAYYLRQGWRRRLTALFAIGLSFYLSVPAPEFLPFLLFPLLAELLLTDPPMDSAGFMLILILSYFALVINGKVPIALKDLAYFIIICGLLIVLRFTQSGNKKQEQMLLELSKSNFSLEKEQAQTKVHVQQLRELYTLEERNRISRDLHDSIGHSLSAIRIQLEAIAQVALTDGEKASAMARKLAIFAEEGLQKLRIVLHQMKPPQYEEQTLLLRLMQIAEDFSAMSQMKVRVTSSHFRYAVNETQDQLIQLALQEFLSNSYRHGQATQVNVHLHYTKSDVTLTMKDNGVGSVSIKKNIGLTGVEERAHKEGGTVHIQTSPGTGFMTQIILPRGEKR